MRWILRGRDLTGATPVVPDLAANLVQRVGGEHHDMKRVDATDRVREPVSDGRGDPAGHVAGHKFDLFAARLAERIEEPRRSCGHGRPRPRPGHPVS